MVSGLVLCCISVALRGLCGGERQCRSRKKVLFTLLAWQARTKQHYLKEEGMTHELARCPVAMGLENS